MNQDQLVGYKLLHLLQNQYAHNVYTMTCRTNPPEVFSRPERQHHWDIITNANSQAP